MDGGVLIFLVKLFGSKPFYLIQNDKSPFWICLKFRRGTFPRTLIVWAHLLTNITTENPVAYQGLKVFRDGGGFSMV